MFALTYINDPQKQRQKLTTGKIFVLKFSFKDLVYCTLTEMITNAMKKIFLVFEKKSLYSRHNFFLQ